MPTVTARLEKLEKTLPPVSPEDSGPRHWRDYCDPIVSLLEAMPNGDELVNDWRTAEQATNPPADFPSFAALLEFYTNTFLRVVPERTLDAVITALDRIEKFVRGDLQRNPDGTLTDEQLVQIVRGTP